MFGRKDIITEINGLTNKCELLGTQTNLDALRFMDSSKGLNPSALIGAPTYQEGNSDNFPMISLKAFNRKTLRR
ncbi:hypothetical protein M0804_005578 [Polistes exclamans]|nr:hypothetical protein M0804_005578 [Polistes exclamans]